MTPRVTLPWILLDAPSTLKTGSGARRRVVKSSRVLDELEAEADVPYEETKLARKATRARPRLALLLILGAAGFALEAFIVQSAWPALGAVILAFTAAGVWKGWLGGVIAAAFSAVLATLISLALLFMGERDVGARVILGFVIVWGAAMLPDVLTLVRDAELQYAYGRWAKRSD